MPEGKAITIYYTPALCWMFLPKERIVAEESRRKRKEREIEEDKEKRSATNSDQVFNHTRHC